MSATWYKTLMSRYIFLESFIDSSSFRSMTANAFGLFQQLGIDIEVGRHNELHSASKSSLGRTFERHEIYLVAHVF